MPLLLLLLFFFFVYEFKYFEGFGNKYFCVCKLPILYLCEFLDYVFCGKKTRTHFMATFLI